MKLLLISAACLFFSACNNKNEKDKKVADTDTTTSTVKDEVNDPVTDIGKISIIGKWKPVEMNLRNMEEEEKKEMITNVHIEFTADGKFIGTNKEKEQKGTYTYNEKNKQLTVVNPAREGKTEKFTISLEGDLLLMTNEEGTVKLKKE